MIVLDTNVLSEVMRAKPDPMVLAWLDAQAPEDLWLNSVVAAELLFGVTTDSGDAEGRFLQTQAVAFTLAELEAVLPSFRGP